MKIALVITGLIMGGAERQVCDLADEFSRLGHDVMLISLNREPVVLPTSGGVQVHHLRMKKTLPGLFPGFFALRAKLRSFRPDVVHAHMIHANIMCRVLRLVTPMKTLICTAHNTNEGGVLRQRLYRYTDRLATLSTNVSQEAVDTFVEKRISFPGRMIAVPNGIDIDRFAFSNEQRTRLRAELGYDHEFVFFSVGRLEQQKDFANLIRAFGLLGESPLGREARLVIVGEGSLREALEDQVSAHNLGERVVFLGRRTDVHALMSVADTFVLSSAWEGFGLVVAEAMLCERVVVATDCGGVKEVLGNHGILVPPAASDALARGMAQAMEFGEPEQKDLGARARRHIVDHYSLPNVAAAWVSIYKRRA